MKIIIVGAGQVGFNTARRLTQENKEVVVIDQNSKVLQRVADSLDVQTLEGSGASPAILEEAGIRSADVLLAVTDSDEINLVACSFANMLAPNLNKIVRIRDEEYLQYAEMIKKQLKISTIVNPDLEIVNTIKKLIGMPGAVEISDFSEGRVKLVGMWVGPKNPLSGIKLIHLRDHIGFQRLIIAAVIRGEQLIIPSGDDDIREGDLVYFVCEDKDFEALLQRFGTPCKEQKNILIIGGGNIGLRLAKSLEKKSINSKLLEHNFARCEFLAEKLNKTVVLHGEGNDREILLEENIQDVDVVVTVTGDEEGNILTSLLAKSLGAKMTITRINKFEYMPMVRAIGLEHIVSPRLSAVNSILKHIRRGKVISTVSIKEEAEAMEAVALDNSELVGKLIKDLKFPVGTLVLCLTRGDEVIIPTGEDQILPEDRIIMLSTRKSISKVEKALTVKLEHI